MLRAVAIVAALVALGAPATLASDACPDEVARVSTPAGASQLHLAIDREPPGLGVGLMVYRESNGVAGLQRADLACTESPDGDTALF